MNGHDVFHKRFSHQPFFDITIYTGADPTNFTERRRDKKPGEESVMISNRNDDRRAAPEWAGPPRQKFGLEILKGGTIVGQLGISVKDHYVFGECAREPAEG